MHQKIRKYWYLWLPQTRNKPPNHFIRPGCNDWTAYLSVYLPTRLQSLLNATHCKWPQSSTRLGLPMVCASELVKFFGGSDLEAGCKGGLGFVQ